MDRRDVLRIGTAAGALFVGERTAVVEAATAAAKKPITSAYSGIVLRRGHEETNHRLTFGVVHGKVSGVIYQDDVPFFDIKGTLRNGKLTAEARYRDNPGFLYFTLVGKLKGAVLKGKVVNEGGFPGGTFSVKRWPVDAGAMRRLAGNYEGIVTEGPGFVGKCQVKPNGSFRLYDATDPDRKPLDKPIPGYYLIKKAPPAQAVGAAPEGAGGAIVGMLLFLCAAGCGDWCGERPTAAEWTSTVVGGTHNISSDGFVIRAGGT